MPLKGSNNEEKIWNYFKDKGLTEYGIAGLMGNLRAESALNPINLQNSYEKKLGFSNESYTNAVDNGTYTNFIKDAAGYGLAQWTYWTRKQNLLKYAKLSGASIGDLEMQLNFLYKELSEGYKGVLKVLETAKSVRNASDIVLTKFEKPANQSEAVKAKRADYGQGYYDKYAKNTIINKGDKVKVINPISYEGIMFRLYHETYDVIQVKNDRAVIGIGKSVTSSINIKNIEKI